MKSDIDYDFDEVLRYIQKSPVTAVEELATNLNSLGKNLTSMEESFHSSSTDTIVYKIYKGFSNIIGNNKSGLSKLDIEAANILNVCYNEALRDKAIAEGNNADAKKYDNESQSYNIVNSSDDYKAIDNFNFNNNYTISELYRNPDGSTYRIMAPNNPTGKCNVVVALSGTGSMNNTNINGGSMVNAIKNMTSDPGNTIYIVPSSISNNWNTSTNSNNILNEIKYVQDNYNTNDSVGVMGHSWGARGALYLATNYPDTFNKVALFSPYDNVDGNFSNVSSGDIKVFYETKAANSGWSGQTPINFGNNQNYRNMWGNENFYQVNGGHNDTPSYALNLDSNGDGVSDIGEFFRSN